MGVFMAKDDLGAAIKNLIEVARQLDRRTHTGLVLNTVAILDNQLERALKKTMQPLSDKFYKELFGSFKPLNTFFSKIIMAHALGVIPIDVYTELEKIRSIRNAFAHSSKSLDFGSEEIAQKLLALKNREPKKPNPAAQFLDCAAAIIEFLEAYQVRVSETSVTP